MKLEKKKLSKVLLSLTMVFAMVLTIMPTNVFAVTYLEPDITVNYTENMQAIEIPADKTTTIKVIFDRKYAGIVSADFIFNQATFGEINVDYGLAVDLSPTSTDIGDEKNLHFITVEEEPVTDFYIPIKVVASTSSIDFDDLHVGDIVNAGDMITIGNSNAKTWAMAYYNTDLLKVKDNENEQAYPYTVKSVNGITKWKISTIDQIANDKYRTINFKELKEKWDVIVNNGTGTEKYKIGDTVTITANSPTTGTQFKEWTVVSGGATLADPTSMTTTFTMPSSEVRLMATYEEAEAKFSGFAFPSKGDVISAPLINTTNEYELTNSNSNAFENFSVNALITDENGNQLTTGIYEAGKKYILEIKVFCGYNAASKIDGFPATLGNATANFSFDEVNGRGVVKFEFTIPLTDKDKVDKAKPLAETAIANVTATNNTTAGNILDAVTAGISSVNGVTASWKAEPIITKATSKAEGSITGTIILTSGSETEEVTVHKTIKLVATTIDVTDLNEGDIIHAGDILTSNGNASATLSPIIYKNSNRTITFKQTYGVSFPYTVENLNHSEWRIATLSGVDSRYVGLTLVKVIHCKVNSGTNDMEHNLIQGQTIEITADAPATGKQFKEWKVISGGVTLADSNRATTTFVMPDEDVELTAIYEDAPHIHTPATAWLKDDTNHWHECTAGDGKKLNIASHTFGTWVIDTPATETTKGSKHRDCTVCGQRETVELPAKVVTSETLIITAGAGSTHEISNSKDMIFTCSGKLEDLTGIYVDSKVVDESNYTLKSGSTILTLKTSYLDTLSEGRHTLKFQYKDHVSAETEFTIITKEATKKDTVMKDTASPKTGDTSNVLLYICLMAFFGCAVGTVIYKRKKLFSK